MSKTPLVIAAIETRLLDQSLLVEREKHETTEEALLWLRRKSKERRSLGLVVELRTYSVNGGVTWLNA